MNHLLRESSGVIHNCYLFCLRSNSNQPGDICHKRRQILIGCIFMRLLYNANCFLVSCLHPGFWAILSFHSWHFTPLWCLNILRRQRGESPVDFVAWDNTRSSGNALSGMQGTLLQQELKALVLLLLVEQTRISPTIWLMYLLSNAHCWRARCLYPSTWQSWLNKKFNLFRLRRCFGKCSWGNTVFFSALYEMCIFSTCVQN